MSLQIKEYKIKIRVKTGLYIGGGDSSLKIGGVDNSFIKHPVSKKPYIPGSSLKGKIRSLLEYSVGIIPVRLNSDKVSGDPLNPKDIEKISDKVSQDNAKILLKLFGIIGDKNNKDYGITRLAFSDFELTEEYKNKDVFEVKAENSIDRTSGTTKNGSLRFTERVGEGTEFEGVISMKILDNDSEGQFEDMLFKGIKFLEHDTLGGSGSRGYGRVEIIFLDEAIKEKYKDINIG